MPARKTLCHRNEHIQSCYIPHLYENSISKCFATLPTVLPPPTMPAFPAIACEGLAEASRRRRQHEWTELNGQRSIGGLDFGRNDWRRSRNECGLSPDEAGRGHDGHCAPAR